MVSKSRKQRCNRGSPILSAVRPPTSMLGMIHRLLLDPVILSEGSAVSNGSVADFSKHSSDSKGEVGNNEVCPSRWN